MNDLTTLDLQALAREAIKRKGLSLTAASAALGVDRGALSNALNKGHALRHGVLRRVVEEMDGRKVTVRRSVTFDVA